MQWTFPTKSLKSGLYDVIIGLTTTELKVDLIETLTFRFAAADGESVAPSEVSWQCNVQNSLLLEMGIAYSS